MFRFMSPAMSHRPHCITSFKTSTRWLRFSKRGITRASAKHDTSPQGVHVRVALMTAFVPIVSQFLDGFTHSYMRTRPPTSTSPQRTSGLDHRLNMNVVMIANGGAMAPLPPHQTKGTKIKGAKGRNTQPLPRKQTLRYRNHASLLRKLRQAPRERKSENPLAGQGQSWKRSRDGGRRRHQRRSPRKRKLPSDSLRAPPTFFSVYGSVRSG